MARQSGDFHPTSLQKHSYLSTQISSYLVRLIFSSVSHREAVS
jgi:hypothetical protein